VIAKQELAVEGYPLSREGGGDDSDASASRRRGRALDAKSRGHGGGAQQVREHHSGRG
jgi:hypothetical protein